LENCIQHSLAVADGDKIKPCYLPGTLKEKEVEVADKVDNKKSLEEVEKEHILRVLQDQGWNISAATRVLGLNRSTIYNKIEKYGLDEYRPE
ncbi:MAG: helix-turn-helix domain-containing protein, partial [bacterium]